MDFSLNEIQTMLADSVDKFIHNEYDFDTRQAYAESDEASAMKSGEHSPSSAGLPFHSRRMTVAWKVARST